MTQPHLWRTPLSWRARLTLGVAVVIAAGLVLGALVGWARWDERWVEADVLLYRPTEDPHRISLDLASCNADHRLRVEESATEVRLHVELRRNTMNDCLDRLDVALSQPLDGRKVIDAADGTTVVAGPA